MKTFKLILMCLLLGTATLVINGCKKDIAATTQSSNPNLSTKGGITFHVKDASGNPIPNAMVGLAVSYTDLKTNTYIASKSTDANGYADLGRFTGGNYYFEADVTIGDTPYHGEGAIQIRNGEDITQELILK